MDKTRACPQNLPMLRIRAIVAVFLLAACASKNKAAPADTKPVTGSLTREAIAAVVNGHSNDVRFCYEQALVRHPKLAGRLAIEWEVNDQGRVTRTGTIENTTGSGEVGTCVQTRIESWAFPPTAPGQSVHIDWNWSFRASAPAAKP